MRRGKLPNDSLDDEEMAALEEVVKGKTIAEAAKELYRKFGLTPSQAKRRRRTAFEKLYLLTGKETEAALKAVLLGIVPFEDVARYYGIPTYHFKEQRRLQEAVSGNYGKGILPLLPKGYISNPYKVNNWLLEEVVPRAERQSEFKPELVRASFSQLLANARNSSITYPPHPHVRKSQAGRPLDGYYYPSVSMDYDNAYISETYLREGPRLLFKPHLEIETLAHDISTDIAKPIFAQDDATADLAREVLENRKHYVQGFRDLVPKWCCLEIYPLTAVKRLVMNGTNAMDDWLQYLGANVLTPEHVEDWLMKQISFLEWHEDTFHIALLDDINHPNNVLTKYISPDFWAVKVATPGQHAMFWEEWPADSQGRRREVDRKVSANNVIQAFIELYSYIWQSMPDDVLIRGREAVRKRLKDQYDNLKPRKG
jgi:hypothetical protein